MKNILTCFSLFILFQNSTMAQDVDIVAAGKTSKHLDSVKIMYVVHEKGQNISIFFSKEDIKNYQGIYAVMKSELVKKDPTLAFLPEVDEGKHAIWNSKGNKWMIRKGGIDYLIKKYG